MPKFIESFCANNDRYKANQKLTPVGVILHSIGCPQPDASVLHNSWANNRSQYLTHYVLDDEKIIHCMPNDRKCYHVGSPGNNKWLGIEMCEPAQIKYKSGATFTVTDAGKAKAYTKKCYDNAVVLLAMLCKQYGWNPYTAILTHNEVTRQKLSNTTHVDPEHLWKGLVMGYTLDTLRKDVASKMECETEKIQTPIEDTPKNEMATHYDGLLSGTYSVTASDGLNVRTGSGTDRHIRATLPYGTKVKTYGYYKLNPNGTKWFYITVNFENETIEGYCSEKYLLRQGGGR